MFVAGCTPSKLAKRYYGSFQILQRIGLVAYRLKLPPDSKIHLVFHCALLKPFHHSSDTDTCAVDLPPQSKDNDPLITPLVILNTKWATTDTGPELQVVVQWQGLPPEDTSWEPWTELKEAYHLEDKVLLNVQGDVMKQPSDKPNQEETSTNLRSKRQSVRPQHLRDFITE